MGANGCFLCGPDPELVYSCDETGVAICGLGPIVEGYSVVATRLHVRSMADAATGESPALLDYVARIRQLLTDRYGSCLATEHGRVPVCARTSNPADPHCYHAHFLMLPGSPTVEQTARAYFARAFEAATLQEALTIARLHDEYFLLSPDPSYYVILTHPGRIFRQFSRWLVANALDQPQLADWRRAPMREKAAATATDLRQILADPD